MIILKLIGKTASAFIAREAVFDAVYPNVKDHHKEQKISATYQPINGSWLALLFLVYLR
ncbi:hypothetical protein ACOI1C_19085 [Bacillus sp. DJP31]|uniref:hypothetical protein n=1 Tax=Bacillus sp. DJP31 TaxID=3409789 RepID=UPI003BB6B1D4